MTKKQQVVPKKYSDDSEIDQRLFKTWSYYEHPTCGERRLEYTRQVHHIVDGKREKVDIHITRTITSRRRKFQGVISPKRSGQGLCRKGR